MMTGQSISHYRILRRLGAGGMGEVYEAEDTDLHRRVALKILSQNLAANPETLERFKREARALAALNHPNIVTIYSVEQADTTHFLTMELVEGRPLSDLIPTGGFTVEKLFALGIPLTDALAAAHTRGIGHRDLKPSNVMVNDQGRVKVIDFGLAKLFQPDTGAVDVEGPTLHQTVEGKILGTPSYMSPEQIEGRKVDHRTDIFSLGILLYEMATAQRPFKGDTAMSVMSSILRDPPRPLTELKPSLPEHLGRIVRRCLQKDPDERYQSALDVRNELKGLEEETKLAQRPALTVPKDSQHTLKDLSTPDRIDPLFAPARSSHSRQKSQRWSWGWMAVILFAFAGAALYWFEFRQRKDSVSQQSGAPGETKPPALDNLRVAVLPFVNMSSDKENEYFAGQMTDQLITKLSAISGLRFIQVTNTIFSARELSQIGQDLNVGAVLRGSVSKAGDQIRINVQLVNAKNSEVLWAKDFVKEFKAVFAIQSEVATQVAAALQVQLLAGDRQRLAKNPTDNLEAYQLYLRGRDRWNLFTGDGFKQAIRFYEEAIKRDTNYALAYAGISDCYTLSSFFGGMHPTNAFPLATRYAKEAVRLDDSLAEAHVSLGMCLLFYEWNWVEAERELKRAVELKPNYADAHHYYAHYFEAMGRLDDAVVQWKTAEDLDPLSLIIPTELGWCYCWREEFNQAINECQKALAMDPNFVLAWQGLAMAYSGSGRYPEAIASIRKAIAIGGGGDASPDLMAELGYAYARSGKTDEARAIIRDLGERKARGTYVDSYFLAYIYAGLDDKPQAIARLNEAFDQHSASLFWLQVDLKFKPLRTEQGFRELLQKMKFKQ